MADGEYSVKELVEFLRTGQGAEGGVLELKDEPTSASDTVEKDIGRQKEVVEDGRGTE